MPDLKFAVITGSTRPGRKSKTIAEWVLAQAAGRPGAVYDLVDLVDFDLPLLDEPKSAKAGGSAGYTQEHTKKWAAAIARYDGFVFITPEYNHSTSGALKNAIDYLYDEWSDKAAALVGYGAVGGARAIEHLRGILSEVRIAHVQQSVSFAAFTDFANWRTPEVTFTPTGIQDYFVGLMFTQLESWATALRDVRAAALGQGAALV